MKQTSQKLHSMLALAAMLLVSAAAFAFPDEDDDDAPKAEAQVNRGFMVEESNFDQWVFQGSRNAAAGRERINSHLKMKLDELIRVCGLTEDQQKKLRLAARGDMKRFFDEVEEVRRKFLKVRNDQNAFNNLWQEIQPLQQQQAKGLFGDTSLFAKTIRRTLTDEQQAKYQNVVEDRRKFRYRAAIEVALHTLANTVALQHDQHEAVLKLVIEETRPPNVFGQHDHSAVMYEMSKLPAAKLKPLLDERQWKLLQQQFNQARGMEGFLIQNGIIDQPKAEILKSVRRFLVETDLGAEERSDAVKEREDTPTDSQKPEQRPK